MFDQRAFLGQIPLILGPSSWGAGMLPSAVPLQPINTPPYFGQWGLRDGSAGGQVGPFNTTDEAFAAAAKAAVDAGASELPTDGFAQVVDSNGRPAGPVT